MLVPPVILVVDDEETMRRSLADILRLEGYQVEAACSGDEALNCLRSKVYDLLLLDLKMPGVDGLQVMEQVSEIAPDTEIIMLTAHGSLESAISALRHKVFDYLLKPSSPQHILDTVSAALTHRAEEIQKHLLLQQLDVALQNGSHTSSRVQSNITGKPVFSLGKGVLVDIARRELWHEADPEEDHIVSLTATECKLLRVFLEHRGEVLSHRELVLRVQGYDVAAWEAPEVLRPLVSRLRHKLSMFEDGASWITNIRGTGYVFELF